MSLQFYFLFCVLFFQLPSSLFISAGHITSLMKADMLDSPLTRLVVLNSIYFKGLWKSCFEPNNTKMRPFTAGDGDVSKVPMMSQLSIFNLGESCSV